MAIAPSTNGKLQNDLMYAVGVRYFKCKFNLRIAITPSTNGKLQNDLIYAVRVQERVRYSIVNSICEWLSRLLPIVNFLMI